MTGERAGRPPVVGVVGGIGSGKSAVARAFAGLGCLVYDADAETRRVLAEPDVVRALRERWGAGVVGAGGAVDRRAVARIVFAGPGERVWLESVVHPRLKGARGELVERARTERRPAVILDAPLLFEAGIEGECDTVVFVDAPRGVRLARVRDRGWDESELDRRESAQLALAEKRARSDRVIDNTGDESALAEAAASVLRSLGIEPPPEPERGGEAPPMV